MSKTGNNGQSFDALMSSIKRTGEKWSGSGGTVDTFAAIHKKMRDNRHFIENERRTLSGQLEDYKKTYSGDYIAKQRVELEREQNEIFTRLTGETRKEIKELIDTKKDKIVEMLETPPSEETVRLLEVLRMRDNLTDVEIQTLLPSFFGNYQAIKALESIAESNGISVTLPVQLDCRAMYDTLDKAESYLLAACDDMAKPEDKRNILYNQFYLYNKDMPNEIYSPEYKEYVALFDHVPQLQEVATEKTQLTPVEKTKLDWYFKDVIGGDDTAILQKTREVMETHPETVQLLSLSEYAPFAMAVEQMKQEESNSGNEE